ncbi:MAG: glycosyltransferase [Acidimicrobiaceae bacterium]
MNSPSNLKSSGDLTILLPAYNEIVNLRVLIPQIIAVTKSLDGIQTEILVVLPSFADSSEVAEINALGAKPVKRHPTDSFGDALRTGFSSSSVSTEFIITMDADCSHNPELIPSLLQSATNAHIVSASRYIRGGSSDAKRRQQAMSRLVNFAFTIVLGEKIHDISGNFKLYRRSIVSQLELEGKNFDIIQEIVFKTKKLAGESFNLVEVTYRWNERLDGKPKRKLIPYILSYVRTLLKFAILRIKP